MTEYEEKSLQYLEWITEELRDIHCFLATSAYGKFAREYLDVLKKKAVPHLLENGSENESAEQTGQ